MTNLKDMVEEFSVIAKTLSDNLQVSCFELLLRRHIETLLPCGRTSGADSARNSPGAGAVRLARHARFS